MAKKTKAQKEINEVTAVVTDQPITETLRTNYMPYAMSVIISRAIPEIDGFKPSHRKLLYTMYKMGLLNGARTKSANVVGQTMKLNPHGDASIYETMVRLTRGNEALLHPFVDSKGTFGKQYSEMAFAASRYTEVKLDSICEELFAGIDKDSVDFVDNYDSTLKEPTLLPTTFPNILVTANTGIAVGMASSICSFNLAEICDTVCGIIENPDFDITQTLKAPDFSTGGLLLYNKEQMDEIYQTGKGSFKVRARYTYDKKANRIEIDQIPYTAKVESIIDKIAVLIKEGKLRDIADVRDETGLDGLLITIDLKRGADPEKLMAKLYKLTPLEDSFPCNFNVLIAGSPRTLGVKDILTEWIAWRVECLKRELYHNLVKLKDRLHLLYGLKAILVDIDKAIKIIRETENEKDVIPNLMRGFDIDEIQANYIAEIKLRNLNKEYICNKISETENLENDIKETEGILASNKKIKSIIAKKQKNIKDKYGKPRKTLIIYEENTPAYEEPKIENYSVNIIFTKDGYLKKLIPYKGNLPRNYEQKIKEGDAIVYNNEVENDYDLVFFTDKCQVYKSKADDFDISKPSMLGDYVPAKLSFDDGENIVMMTAQKEYKGYVAIFFENGKAVKIPMSAYATKTNRKKLTSAYSADSKAVGIFYIPEKETKAPSCEFLLNASNGKAIIINSDQLTQKTTRTAGGVYVFTLKKGQKLQNVSLFVDDKSEKMMRYSKYRKLKLPSTGSTFTEEAVQLTID